MHGSAIGASASFVATTGEHMSTTDDLDWRAQAACVDVEPETFYLTEMQDDAARTCARCTVRATCLETALDEERYEPRSNIFGYRGGKTAQERGAILDATRHRRTTTR